MISKKSLIALLIIIAVILSCISLTIYYSSDSSSKQNQDDLAGNVNLEILQPENSIPSVESGDGQ